MEVKGGGASRASRNGREAFSRAVAKIGGLDYLSLTPRSQIFAL
jgi:hypothetical protein